MADANASAIGTMESDGGHGYSGHGDYHDLLQSPMYGSVNMNMQIGTGRNIVDMCSFNMDSNMVTLSQETPKQARYGNKNGYVGIARNVIPRRSSPAGNPQWQRHHSSNSHPYQLHDSNRQLVVDNNSVEKSLLACFNTPMTPSTGDGLEKGQLDAEINSQRTDTSIENLAITDGVIANQLTETIQAGESKHQQLSKHGNQTAHLALLAPAKTSKDEDGDKSRVNQSTHITATTGTTTVSTVSIAKMPITTVMTTSTMSACVLQTCGTAVDHGLGLSVQSRQSTAIATSTTVTTTTTVSDMTDNPRRRPNGGQRKDVKRKNTDETTGAEAGHEHRRRNTSSGAATALME